MKTTRPREDRIDPPRPESDGVQAVLGEVAERATAPTKTKTKTAPTPGQRKTGEICRDPLDDLH